MLRKGAHPVRCHHRWASSYSLRCLRKSANNTTTWRSPERNLPENTLTHPPTHTPSPKFRSVCPHAGDVILSCDIIIQLFPVTLSNAGGGLSFVHKYSTLPFTGRESCTPLNAAWSVGLPACPALGLTPVKRSRGRHRTQVRPMGPLLPRVSG